MATDPDDRTAFRLDTLPPVAAVEMPAPLTSCRVRFASRKWAAPYQARLDTELLRRAG